MTMPATSSHVGDGDGAPSELSVAARIAALADDGSLEIGGAARSQQPSVADVTPRDGVTTAFARVHGRDVLVVAEDARVLERSDGEVARLKRNRALSLARSVDIPVVALIDGPSDVPQFEKNTGELAGRMADPRLDFNPATRRSLLVCVALGRVVGASRDLMASADLVIATEAVHRELSGASRSLVDAVEPDELSAVRRARNLLDRLAGAEPGGRHRFGQPWPESVNEAIDVDVMASPSRLAEMLADAGSFVAIHREPDSVLVSGAATVGGWPVLVVAVGGGDAPELGTAELRSLARLYRLAARASCPVIVVEDCAGLSREAVDDLAALNSVTSALRDLDKALICVVAGDGHTLGTFPLGSKQLRSAYIIAWPWARLAVSEPVDYRTETLSKVREPDPWLAAARGLVDDVRPPHECASLVAQLVALFGERWTPPLVHDRLNAQVGH